MTHTKKLPEVGIIRKMFYNKKVALLNELVMKLGV